VDDSLLQAETEEDLLSILRIALVACRKGNLTLSKDKIKWGQKIGFAGYIISNTGVYPDPARTLAIRQFPVPKDLSSLRGFLGLANQLGHFLPDLAHMTVNLRLLLKKDVNFLWLQQPHQEDFELICKILTSDLVVRPFDPKLKTELLTDASKLKGLGYALLQRKSDNRPRLIQCGSRSLSPAEKNYACIEIESLAIQYDVEDCRFYILGALKFTIFTDHKTLQNIYVKALSEIINPRILNHRLKLTHYSGLTVTWTEGSGHMIADALLQNPVFDPPTDNSNDMALCYGISPRDLHLGKENQQL
jgi:hypothetical protein